MPSSRSDIRPNKTPAGRKRPTGGRSRAAGSVVAAQLAKNLRAIRLSRGLTQKELCGRVGVAQGYYSSLENGLEMHFIAKLEGWITAIGGDPLDLLRPAGIDTQDAEVASLYRALVALPAPLRSGLLLAARGFLEAQGTAPGTAPSAPPKRK